MRDILEEQKEKLLPSGIRVAGIHSDEEDEGVQIADPTFSAPKILLALSAIGNLLLLTLTRDSNFK